MGEYQELKALLEQLIGPVKFDATQNLKLERITQLLEIVGNPHFSFPSIHVGGTSGKGSTSALISSILVAAGYKTGLHTSPYLQVINEGFQINNTLVPTSTLLKILKQKLLPAVEKVGQTNPFGKPSYFETKTALAFLLFAQEKVDVAVVEVGLGGTLDATNVLPATVAVLTSVGLDHTEILGDTIEKIITDKAGIIKKNQTVISGVTQPSAQHIIADRCKKVEARKLLQIGKEFEPLPTSQKINLPGEFQRSNAACAVEAAKAFDPHISQQAITTGLRTAFLPGRMEIVQEKPLVILDGAHNPDKIAALMESLKQQYPKEEWIVIFAAKSDKDHQAMLRKLERKALCFVTTEFHDAALWSPHPAADLKTQLETITSKNIIAEQDPRVALKKALAISQENDQAPILITGSLYLLGNIREHWYPSKKML